RSKGHTPGQVPDAADREVVAFVVEGRTEVFFGERALRIARIVTERTTVLVVTHRARERVVRAQIDVVERTLTIADIHAVVAGASDRHFVAHAAQQGHARCSECRVQWQQEPPSSSSADSLSPPLLSA